LYESAQVLIKPGIPGIPNLRLPDDLRPYPDTAIDLAKVLRARGISVTFEDERSRRGEVSHKAADIWLPILEIAASLMVGVGTNLLSSLMYDLLGEKRARSGFLHVQWEIVDGEYHEEFRADGTGTEVLDALDQFERRVRKIRGTPGFEGGPKELRQGDAGGTNGGEEPGAS
jgi:hypothetical protein